MLGQRLVRALAAHRSRLKSAMKAHFNNSSLLRQLRSLNVVVFHPEDQDGQEVIGQLHRIGCRVQAFWPPLERLPPEVDLVFLAVRPEVLSIDLPWLRRDGAPCPHPHPQPSP